jgi:predicted nucleotidyltransferase
MVDPSIIDIARKYLDATRAEMKIENAYLFGSCAKGMARKESDIDIALVLDKIDNFFETQIKLMKLRRKIDLRIEPHPILEKDFDTTNPLAKEILETGVLIQ